MDEHDIDYKTLSLGELIDEMYACRETKRTFEAEIKELNSDIDELSGLILDKMQELGVSSIKSGRASASITQQIVPQVDDFDEVLNWISDDFDGRKHILQRRIAARSWRELEQIDEKVPGVTAYTKRSVGLRKLQS